jgi:vacuolar iron transporter family protein
MPVHHRERHRTQHVGWLRAAVLGANDGIDPASANPATGHAAAMTMSRFGAALSQPGEA